MKKIFTAMFIFVLLSIPSLISATEFDETMMRTKDFIPAGAVIKIVMYKMPADVNMSLLNLIVYNDATFKSSPTGDKCGGSPIKSFAAQNSYQRNEANKFKVGGIYKIPAVGGDYFYQISYQNGQRLEGPMKAVDMGDRVRYYFKTNMVMDVMVDYPAQP